LNSVKVSSENDFEKNLIYITAGTLILSLTFVEKVTPLPEAIHVWMIITSWGFLAASLILNIISHWFSINRVISFEKILIDTEISGNEINERIDKENNQIQILNTATLGTMIVGIIFLVLYCSFNTVNMSQKEKNI